MMRERYYCPEDPAHQLYADAVSYETCLVDEDGHWADDIETHEYQVDTDSIRCDVCDRSAKWGIPPSPLERLAEAGNDGPDTSST